MERVLVVIIIVLALVCALLWIMLFALRNFLVQVAARFGAKSMPDHITLTEKPDANWEDAPIKSDVLDLQQFGFSRIRAWVVPELQNILIYGFVNEAQRCYGAIYFLYGRVWVEFFGYFEGSGSLTASNSAMAGALDAPPGKLRVACPKATNAATWSAFTHAAHGKVFQPVSREQFKFHMERVYAEDMVWRKKRRVTADEVKRVAERSGRKVDDPTAQAVADATNEGLNAQ